MTTGEIVPVAGAVVRIIPVLDVLAGAVVRAVGGRRSEYRPVVSRLTASTDSVAVAEALLNATGASELYVADLDAITGGEGRMSAGVEALLKAMNCTLLVDAGLRGASELTRFAAWPHVRPVLASETDIFPPPLSKGGEEVMSRAVYSVDMLGTQGFRPGLRTTAAPRRQNGSSCVPEGRPDVAQGLRPGPEADSALDLVAHIVARGFRSVILLDLAHVGERRGPGTATLCAEVRRHFPHVELITGGGVRHRDDLKRLEDAGADAVLVASALHDGTLP